MNNSRNYKYMKESKCIKESRRKEYLPKTDKWKISDEIIYLN